MNKSIIFKISIVISIILSILFFTINTSNAFNPDDYKPTDQTGGYAISNIANLIVGLVQVVGSGVSIIAIIIIGIKYMIGSVEEKADYKKTLGPYLIGAIMVFSISNVIKIIYDFASKI